MSQKSAASCGAFLCFGAGVPWQLGATTPKVKKSYAKEFGSLSVDRCTNDRFRNARLATFRIAACHDSFRPVVTVSEAPHKAALDELSLGCFSSSVRF